MIQRYLRIVISIALIFSLLFLCSNCCGYDRDFNLNRFKVNLPYNEFKKELKLTSENFITNRVNTKIYVKSMYSINETTDSVFFITANNSDTNIFLNIQPFDNGEMHIKSEELKIDMQITDIKFFYKKVGEGVCSTKRMEGFTCKINGHRNRITNVLTIVKK